MHVIEMKWAVFKTLIRQSFEYKLKVKVPWWPCSCSQIAVIDDLQRKISRSMTKFCKYCPKFCHCCPQFKQISFTREVVKKRRHSCSQTPTTLILKIDDVMSLFHIVISCIYCSWTWEVWASVLMTVEPGADNYT